MNMNVSGIRWSDQTIKQETKKRKALGKGFDEILNTEMNAIKKKRKLGGIMKYTVINHDRAMQLIFDESESKNLFLIDYTKEGQLALYPIVDMSIESIERDINEESEFLYKGSIGTKANVVMVCDDQQDTVYGTYDFNTPLEKQYVNELANRLRERPGVVSTYVSQI